MTDQHHTEGEQAETAAVQHTEAPDTETPSTEMPNAQCRRKLPKKSGAFCPN